MTKNANSGMRTVMVQDRARYARALWLAWMFALSAFFVHVAAIDLENFRPFSNDEGWIMSVSYKLASQGVFGTDMLAAFFHADQHYFINLPVQHFLQAGVFRVFGPGVTQARMVSLAAAVLLLWLVSDFAYRWHGLLTSIMASGLLVLWRSDFIASYPGLPLLAVARSARYDITAVTFAWLTFVLLASALRRATGVKSLALGLCAGLASLTQFFGAFVMPLIGLAWLWHFGRRTWRYANTGWLMLGLALTAAPYAAYIASAPADFIGQVSVQAGRAQFTSPDFYLENVRREPERYVHLLRAGVSELSGMGPIQYPIGIWLLIVLAPAFIYLCHRAKRANALAGRLLLLSIVSFAAWLTIGEQTKSPLYCIVLYPAICLMLAAFGADAIRSAWRTPPSLPTRLLGAAGTTLLIVIVADGGRAYREDLRQSTAVSHYLTVGEGLKASITPEARIMGPERWWWALHTHPYQALYWIFEPATLPSDIRAQRVQVEIAGARPGFLIIDDSVRSEDPELQSLQAHYWALLQMCSMPVANWVDATYGHIEVYRVNRAAPNCWP